MVKPMFRSRSLKKTKKRTPGARTVVHYKEKKTQKKECARCGELLAGTASDSVSAMSKLSKTEKKPTRPYSGVLCANCVEAIMAYKTRMEVKFKFPEYNDMEITRDLTLEKFLERGWYNKLANKA